MFRRINQKHKTFVLLLITAMFCLTSYSQDKNRLKADKEKLEAEIIYNNKLLEETKKTKKSSLNQLVILNNKIEKREDLIFKINSEISMLESSIKSTRDDIKELKKDLENLKEEYASLVYYAYKNRNAYDRLMFIFSSEDFNQAYQRLKYLQQYSSYRKTQAELVQQKQAEYNTQVQKLEDQKIRKMELAKEKEAEVDKLLTEKNEKDKTVRVLSSKEKELMATIKKKEKEADRLQNEIERIIAEEMRAAAERAREDKAVSKTGTASLSSVDLALSNDFESNKGKLPWPSDKGIISGTFGEHRHPVLKKVKTKNNGIDILTGEEGLARSVFDGEIVSVNTITSTNKAVIIRHGEYFTVYSNLSEIYVKRGDKVTTMQSIGKIYTNGDDRKTELHFEIWKGKSLLNPSSWIINK